MALSDYQRERVNDVRQWYESIYCPLDGYAPQSIRYMALWAVFNALYNVADYPKVKLKRVNNDDGMIKPVIRGGSEDDKLRFISRRLAQQNQLIANIFRDHSEFITYLGRRTPEVQQPPHTQSVQFQHDGDDYSIDLSKLHGIASIDSRVFLNDGTVLFQYHSLELVLDDDHLPRDKQKFFRQLIYVLYQLRNNIVHGGSAAFFMRKTELSIGAIGLLDDIVRHLFNNPELLEQNA